MTWSANDAADIGVIRAFNYYQRRNEKCANR